MFVRLCRSLAGLVATGLLLAACDGSSSVAELASPAPVRCQIALGSSSATVPASTSQVQVTVLAERECAWSAQSHVSWVQVSPTASQGEGAVTLTVAANPSAAARAGTVSVSGESFQISQNGVQGPTCSYTLTPASRQVGEGGGNRTVRVTTAPGCPWSATTNVPWLSIASARQGTGTADITYRVERNRSSSSRTGQILVANRSHLVRQSGD